MPDDYDPEDSDATFAREWGALLTRLSPADRALVDTALVNSGGASSLLPLSGGVVIGALLTAVYVLRAVKMIFFGPPNAAFDDVPDAQGVEWVTLIVLAGMLILLGFFPRLILDSIQLGVGEVLAGFGG